MNNNKKSCYLENWGEVYEGIIMNSPNGIIIINEEYEIIQYNEGAEKITNITKNAALGEKISNIFPGITDALLEKNEFDYSLPDKTLYIKKLLLSEEQIDKPVTILLVQDLDELVAVSTEVKTGKNISEYLKIVFEKSFDGILVTDGKGNVILVNKAYERVTGIKRDEMIGKNMVELLNSNWMRDSVVFPVIEKMGPVSMTHTTRNNKNIIVTGVPVCDGETISMVIVNARDVSEMYELKEELLKSREMEKLYYNQLKKKVNAQTDDIDDKVIIVSSVMQEIYSLAKKISSYDTNVLILGESGVGKEEVAKYIHKNSPRNENPFVVINCAAIPENLLESELFGYEKGAFTGAEKGKQGLFETAEKGTLFLDEIGDMSPVLQVKLLRVLETRKITHLGGTKAIPIDIRLLAATNKDLKKMVAEEQFREDLYYRLNVIEIEVPPLRKRIEDIGPLSLYFVNILNKKYGQNKKLTYDVINQLEQRPWSGNVRELKNVIERMIVISNNEYIQISDLITDTKGKEDTGTINSRVTVNGIVPLNEALNEAERQILVRAMEEYKSTRKIAEALKVSQSTIVYKMDKHNLNREEVLKNEGTENEHK